MSGACICDWSKACGPNLACPEHGKPPYNAAPAAGGTRGEDPSEEAAVADLRDLEAEILAATGYTNLWRARKGGWFLERQHPEKRDYIQFLGLAAALRSQPPGAGSERRHLAAMAHKHGVAASLAWALDMVEMYERRLIELGDPADLVQSPQQRAALTRAREAQVAQERFESLRADPAAGAPTPEEEA